MEDIKIDTINWSAPEYFHKEHSNDWFWTIGLVTLVACVGAIWYHNYVFAIFLFLSGVCIFIFTTKEPKVFDFIIDQKGITVNKETFLWKQIKTFNLKKLENEEYDKLILETSKNFLPIYGFFIPKELSPKIKAELQKVLSLSEIEESRTVQFAEKIGI